MHTNRAYYSQAPWSTPAGRYEQRQMFEGDGQQTAPDGSVQQPALYEQTGPAAAGSAARMSTTILSTRMGTILPLARPSQPA